MLVGYSTVRHYDMRRDAEVNRISAQDEQGAVWWVTVPVADSGARRRADRERALSALEDAAARGDPPGEVVLEWVA